MIWRAKPACTGSNGDRPPPNDRALLYQDQVGQLGSTVKLAESRLGQSRVGRLNGRDDNGSRPDLRRLSLPR